VNTISANKPAGTVGTDVMLAYLAVRGGTGVTDGSITVPAGWTRIDRIDNGANLSLLVYWKTNAGAETSYAWSWTGTAQKPALLIGSYINVDTANPIDAHAGAPDSTLSGFMATPDVVTTYEYEMRVASAFVASTGGCTTGWYSGEGFPTSSGGSASTNISGGVQYSNNLSTGQETSLPAGPAGGARETCSAATAVLHHLALKPAAHTCTITATLKHAYAPQYVSAQSATRGTGTTTFTINTPSGAAANDVLVASITYSGGTGTTITAPAGWTLVKRTDNGTTIGLAVYSLVLAGAPAASYQWTGITSGAFLAGGVAAYRNVDNATPWIAGEQNGQTTAAPTCPASCTHTTPSVIAAVPDSMVVASFATAADDTWTEPAGMVEAFDTVTT
ncbi:MAG TPA: hypothetical protein VKJ07_03565, partial [Mycobacteriales bacterium]|nr:hypothetical protein [Mycobacteriales bacterium]